MSKEKLCKEYVNLVLQPEFILWILKVIFRSRLSKLSFKLSFKISFKISFKLTFKLSHMREQQQQR